MSEGEERVTQREPIFRDIRRYYCEYCGICRSKKSLLTSHILSVHPEEVKKREMELDEEGEGQKCDNTCEECGDSFKKPAHLKQHMLCHSIERLFVCPLDDCLSSFRRKDHLNRHLLKHQGKLFKCPMEGCNQEFNVQSNMKRHIKEFHEGKPASSNVKEKNKYVCQEVGCGKEFKFPSQLRSHEETHVKVDSSEALCADPSCMKLFSNVECLRAHIRSCHQYIRCEVCGSKHLKKNMKRHLLTHDEEHPPKTIKCSFEGCDRTFTTNSNLRQHVKAVHLQLRPYACSIPGCGMRFASKRVRDNHEKTAYHVYAHGDLEEFDEQFRSRSRGGRKREYPTTEMLSRKRVTLPNQGDGVVNQSTDYLDWLLSEDPDEQ